MVTSKKGILLLSSSGSVDQYKAILNALMVAIQGERRTRKIRMISVDDAARATDPRTPLAKIFRDKIRAILAEYNWTVGHSTLFRLFGTNVKETQESRHKDAQSLDKYVKDDEYVTLFVVSGGNTNWLMQGFDWNTRFRDILTMAVREGKAGYISYSAGTIAAGLDA